MRDSVPSSPSSVQSESVVRTAPRAREFARLNLKLKFRVPDNGVYLSIFGGFETRAPSGGDVKRKVEESRKMCSGRFMT